MVFLRAFPFSLSILWRFVVALPGLIIALLAFGFLAGILLFISSLISPFIAMLFAIAFGVGASVVPVMVGLRVGLQSFHIKPRINYLGMMKPAIGYGLFEAVVILILLAGCAAIFMFATSFDPQSFLAMDLTDEDALMAELTAVSPVLTWGLLGFLGLATFALRSALLVPFAGASVGMDPSGRPHTPFYGFGSGFGSIFALVLLSQLGLTFAVPLAIIGFEMAGLAQSVMMDISVLPTIGEFADLAKLSPYFWAFIGVTLLLFLFFFSLQCAGAVLVYMGTRGLYGARQEAFDEVMREEEERDQPMENTDLRELLRSRMPDKKY